MADQFSSEIDVGPPPIALRRRKPVKMIMTIIVLVILGISAGVIWWNYDRLTDSARSLVDAGPDTGTVPAAAPPDNVVSTKDFEAFQQQTATSLQSVNDALSAQQAQAKRLSDQIADLTSRIDQLQNSAAPVPPASAARPAAGIARPSAASIPPRKRPPASKPAGAISVGGAPLPVQPGR